MPGKIPKDKYININTISLEIDNCINDFLLENQIETDYKSIVNTKHSTVNYMLTYIYNRLFKPDITLCNNQKSLVDYNNIELLQVLAEKYISICQRFNKSLGLISFGYMIGCSTSTLYEWLSKAELNPARSEILKYIQESHKAQQIALLNDSPVGALAVANNDTETGLKWAANQVQQITNNTVYYLPSERTDKLKLEKLDS